MRLKTRIASIAGLLGLLLIGAAHADTYFPILDAPTTNAAVTITAGGTFQVVLAQVVNPTNNATARHSLTVQNNNTNSDSCWVYIGTGSATTGKSIVLSAGTAYTRYYPYIPSDQIQATCTTTGDTLYVDYN